MSGSAGASTQSTFDPTMLLFLQQWLAAQQTTNSQSATVSSPLNMTPESLQAFNNSQIDQAQENQALDYEAVQRQIKEALKNAEQNHAQVADLAQFQNPALQTLTASMEVSNTSSSITLTDDQSVHSTFHPEKQISLDSTQIFALPSSVVGGGKEFFIQDKVTGNGMLIQGDKIYSIVAGNVVATGSLAALAQGQNLTINLQNGAKLTFIFDSSKNPPALDRLNVTNPLDNSFAEMINLQDGANPLQINSGTAADASVVSLMDYMVPDGVTLWLDPAGAALHSLDTASNQFIGVFGDPQALGRGLSAASFGGNIYNFFYSNMDMGWHAYLNSGSPPPPPGSPGMMGGSTGAGVDSGSAAVDSTQSGLYVPPSFWKNNFGIDSIEDLITEDFSGNPKADMLEQAKKSFLRHELQFGKMDLETKLMILLYLFIDDNNQDIDDLLKKLGYDKNGDPVQVTPPDGGWTPENIAQAPIKVQMDFWGDYKAPADASQDTKEDIAFKKNQSLQAAGLDQTILQAQLTNVIRDRAHFIETVDNSLKVLSDTLGKIIRNIL